MAIMQPRTFVGTNGCKSSVANHTLYLHMSNHYRRLYGARSIVDTSPPLAYSLRQHRKQSPSRCQLAFVHLVDSSPHTLTGCTWSEDEVRQRDRTKQRGKAARIKPCLHRKKVLSSSDIIEQHANSFKSPDRKFNPRILKTEAQSRVRDMRVYHPPRRGRPCDCEERALLATAVPKNVSSKVSSRDSAYSGGVSSGTETPEQLEHSVSSKVDTDLLSGPPDKESVTSSPTPADETVLTESSESSGGDISTKSSDDSPASRESSKHSVDKDSPMSPANRQPSNLFVEKGPPNCPPNSTESSSYSVEKNLPETPPPSTKTSNYSVEKNLPETPLASKHSSKQSVGKDSPKSTASKQSSNNSVEKGSPKSPSIRHSSKQFVEIDSPESHSSSQHSSKHSVDPPKPPSIRESSEASTTEGSSRDSSKQSIDKEASKKATSSVLFAQTSSCGQDISKVATAILKTSDKASKISEVRDKKKEDAAYVQFVYNITEDVLARGVYSNTGLQQLFMRHIEDNENFLDHRRMQHEVDLLCRELGVPPIYGEFNNNEGESNFPPVVVDRACQTPKHIIVDYSSADDCWPEDTAKMTVEADQTPEVVPEPSEAIKFDKISQDVTGTSEDVTETDETLEDVTEITKNDEISEDVTESTKTGDETSEDVTEITKTDDETSEDVTESTKTDETSEVVTENTKDDNILQNFRFITMIEEITEPAENDKISDDVTESTETSEGVSDSDDTPKVIDAGGMVSVSCQTSEIMMLDQAVGSNTTFVSDIETLSEYVTNSKNLKEIIDTAVDFVNYIISNSVMFATKQNQNT